MQHEPDRTHDFSETPALESRLAVACAAAWLAQTRSQTNVQDKGPWFVREYWVVNNCEFIQLFSGEATTIRPHGS
jgi:hypothetical protein